MAAAVPQVLLSFFILVLIFLLILFLLLIFLLILLFFGHVRGLLASSTVS